MAKGSGEIPRNRSRQTNASPFRPALAHGLRWLSCGIALFGASLAIDNARLDTSSLVLYHLAVPLAIAGILGYPAVALAADIVRTWHRYRTGQALQMSFIARAALGLLVLLGIASSGSATDALIRTATAGRVRQLASKPASQRQICAARIGSSAFFLLVVVELAAVLTVQEADLRNALMWATFFTLLGGALAFMLVPAIAVLRNVFTDSRNRRRRASWSIPDDMGTQQTSCNSDGTLVTGDDTILFPRNEQTRRRYINGAKHIALFDVAVVILVLGALLAAPAPARTALFHALPGSNYVIAAILFLSMAAAIPLLFWWEHRWALSLTQTIALRGDELSYAITNGSGEAAVTVRYVISSVTSCIVKRDVIIVAGVSAGTSENRPVGTGTGHERPNGHPTRSSSPASNRLATKSGRFSLRIPRTFYGEERFLTELSHRQTSRP